MMSLLPRPFALAIALGWIIPGVAAAGPPPSRGEAQEVFGRLLAPCCWAQTLDVHESDVASTLRSEIAARLLVGESTHAIEDDLAARYGERIRAVPRGRDTRTSVAVWVFAAMAIALLVLCLVAQRWVRRNRCNDEHAQGRLDKAEHTALDARLDRELELYDKLR